MEFRGISFSMIYPPPVTRSTPTLAAFASVICAVLLRFSEDPDKFRIVFAKRRTRRGRGKGESWPFNMYSDVHRRCSNCVRVGLRACKDDDGCIATVFDAGGLAVSETRMETRLLKPPSEALRTPHTRYIDRLCRSSTSAI